MPSCSFDKCLNHSGKQKKSTGITFHAFPKDELWRHKWLCIVRKQRQELDWIATDNSRVCSSHFKSEDIYTTPKGLRRIKKGAVPLVQIKTKSLVIPVPGSEINSPNSLKNVVISDLDSIFETPRKAFLKRRIRKICISKKKLCMENKNLKGKNKRLKEKYNSLKQTVLNLKKKLNITEDQFRELSSRAEVADLYQRMTNRIKSNKNIRMKFSPSLRKFALTLNFYSPAGYKYVRKVFKNCLPHPRTLGKWYENTDASPGFTTQAFEVLKKKHSASGNRILCTLIVDEMAIRQQSIWNGKKTLGLVNHGAGSMDTDQIASQVFVMMLVSINQNWKLPVGYFFVNGITSESRANLIKICLTKCWEVGVDVVALTFDGCSSNINAANLLGCQLSNFENLKTTFKHPSCDIDVAVFLDPCHMVKLVRNTLESKKIFHDDQGGEIKWQFWQSKLHFHKLIVLKDMGGLCYPSYDLFKICVKCETALKMFIRENQSQHFVCEKQVMRLKLNTIETFVQSDILSNLTVHSQDQPVTFNHRTHLLKAIIDKYCDVRLHYIHKIDSAISSTTKRQKRNKLSLFEGT